MSNSKTIFDYLKIPFALHWSLHDIVYHSSFQEDEQTILQQVQKYGLMVEGRGEEEVVREEEGRVKLQASSHAVHTFMVGIMLPCFVIIPLYAILFDSR